MSAGQSHGGTGRLPRLAKITRPKLPRVFLRSRLFRHLDSARGRPVAWVTGWPGSGKTTLVASYVDSRKLPCVWYRVDEGDGDVATFFYFLGIAARKAAPRRKEPLPVLAPEYRAGLVTLSPAAYAGLVTFSRRYFRELCSRLGRSFVIVFDDYQRVAPDSPLHTLIAEALCEIPEGGRAIVISRGDPPPALARLRANGNMDVIGGDEMRLTLQESVALARLWGPQSRRDIAAAHERVQGWAAGLVLSLAQPGSAHRSPPREGAPSAIFDYFAGEIFQRVEPRTRTFLVETALLPRTTTEMAERLTGMGQAGRLFDRLVRGRYFTMRGAEPDPFYEYHPLFRKFLLSQADSILPQARRTELLRAAAALLADRGQFEDAVELLRQACAWQEMARLLLEQAPALLQVGRGAALCGWLRQLPDDLVQRSAWLLHWLGVALLPRDIAQARRHLERAFDLFAPAGDARGLYLTWAQIVESYFLEGSEYAPLDRWIEAFDELRRQHPGFPTPEIEARVTCTIFTAFFSRQPDHPRMPEWADRLLTIALRGTDLRLRMSAGSALLHHAMYTGDTARARILVESLGPLATRVPHVSAVLTWQTFASLYARLTDCPEAGIRVASAGLELGRETGIHFWDRGLHGQLAFCAIARDRYDEARSHLRQMAGELGPSRPLQRDRGYCELIECILALRQGDAATALEHGSASAALTDQAGVPFLRMFGILVWGMAALEAGDFETATLRLEEARRFAARTRSLFIEFLAVVALARLALEKGDRESAAERLRGGLAIGRRCGFVELGLWHDLRVTAELCAVALELGIEVEYVQAMVRRWQLVPGPSAMDVELWPWSARIRTLGAFAIERDDGTPGGERRRVARKVQKRPLQLLKLLVAVGAEGTSEYRVAEALWPDADGAHHALEMTVHRLRRLLGQDDAIRVREERIAIDATVCWVDAWAFERRARAAIAALERQGGERAAMLAERALALYRGPVLADEDEPWVLERRKRMTGLHLRLVEALRRHWERAGQPEKALGYAQRGSGFSENALRGG